jgi:cell division protein FtsI/penicillin-binding protein 2
MVLFVFVLWLLLIVGAMAQFMVVRGSREMTAMTRESVVYGEIPALRGRLLGRDGQLLAWSVRRVRLLWDRPADPVAARAAVQTLRARLPWLTVPPGIDVPPEGEGAMPVVLAVGLSPGQVREMKRARLRGLRIEGYVERQCAVLPPTLLRRLGETRWERGGSLGISGLEQEHDALLAGQPGIYRVVLDKHGRWVEETWREIQPMRPGYDVHVSLTRGR